MKNDSSKSKASLSDNKTDETCTWYINSPEHNNCFWTYVKSRSRPDGSMPEVTLAEISRLLGWSNTKAYFMLKAATAELIEALTKNQINNLNNLEVEHSIDLPEIEPIQAYNNDHEE